jgi:hypothetical protein
MNLLNFTTFITLDKTEILQHMTNEEKFINEREKIVQCLKDTSNDIKQHTETCAQLMHILNDVFGSSINVVNEVIVDYITDLSKIKHVDFLKLVHWIIHTAENDLFASVSPPVQDDKTRIFTLAMYHKFNNIDWNKFWHQNNPIFSSKPKYVEILLYYYSTHYKDWEDCEQLTTHRDLLQQLKYVVVGVCIWRGITFDHYNKYNQFAEYKKIEN